MEVKFAFYECDNDDCLKRFAVEEVEGEEVEEPICPACQGTMCIFSGVRTVDMVPATDEDIERISKGYFCLD
ncbi:hypothetical protein KZ483_24170 [Paenibacillus sp. sptzw28]|uniref:hypothetical protein n=1 Tax=Paenibacillus sp. sptzw28 TaxID=715179 RepID=UPI001C6E87E2|nr:hypothetical protein [Paenibacillus sp. sptzw28]QYR20818.1 hypothetical protein KZ483_24170 [Paenibacillus sp. sptzw28]